MTRQHIGWCGKSLREKYALVWIHSYLVGKGMDEYVEVVSSLILGHCYTW